MAIQSDFMSAIRQICAERGIEVDDVVEAIKTAMLSAYRKGYETGETLTVEIDPEFIIARGERQHGKRGINVEIFNHECVRLNG